MGAGAHCGDEPGDPCPSAPVSIDESSELFDVRDVRAAEWRLSGSWIYSAGYGYTTVPVRYELVFTWTGEAFGGHLFECPDGSRRKWGLSFPMVARFTTDDGAFDESFPARVSGPVEGTLYVEIDDFPAGELTGSFMLPDNYRAPDCTDPVLTFTDMRIDVARRRATVLDIHDPGYAWAKWLCEPSAYPIGRPSLDLVRPANAR